MILELDNVKYELVPGGSKTGYDCQGCAFQKLDHCPNTDYLNTACSSDNNTTDMIWKEIKNMNKQDTVLDEPKYTVQEVLTALEELLGWFPPTTSTTHKDICDYLKLQTNPEYKLYLKLKDKFEAK